MNNITYMGCNVNWLYDIESGELDISCVQQVRSTRIGFFAVPVEIEGSFIIPEDEISLKVIIRLAKKMIDDWVEEHQEISKV